MRLDRNINEGGKCKYAVVKMRLLKAPLQECLDVESGEDCWLVPKSAMIILPDDRNEFFVLMLKDQFAAAALEAYANAAVVTDTEYAADVQQLAHKSRRHPDRRRPD
jgi:hypothetical protein